MNKQFLVQLGQLALRYPFCAACLVLSVLFAIALFWLGMAEITAGRWRWVNLVTGIIIFVVTLGMFGAVELFFLSGGGAA